MKNIIISLLCLVISSQVLSQIATTENPISFKENLKSTDIPVFITPGLNFTIINEEDSIDNINGLAPRFGFDFDVNINMENSGRWTDLPSKKGKVWQLEIYCPGALSINLLYDKFQIPEGGKFFIYSPDKKKKLGAFTKKNNKGNQKQPGTFATSLILNERIILEYYNPKEANERPIVSISKIVHGYKYLKVFGDSGNCNRNINCDEGDDWQDEKTGVALIVVGGTRWCTGSLINNTNEDGRPFLLTADHCLESSGLDAITNSNASTWTFLWNYESPDCIDGTDFTPVSTSGATVIANNSTSDFALLELDESPSDLSPSLCLYYNGWNKSGSVTSNTTCIHHPSGDIKKISIDEDSPSTNGNFWRVNDWDLGTTEGGSSGSPLFDSAERIIGQLKGGHAACGNDLYDDYGKLSVSWSNSTDSRRKLKDWLDPSGINPNTLDGAYLFPTNNTNITGSSIICSSESYSLNNLPAVDSIVWEYGPYLTISSGQNTSQCTFAATSNGSSWVRARLVNGCASITLPQQTVWVGAPVISSIDGPQGARNNYWAYYSAVLESSLSAPTDYTWTLSPLNGNYVYEHGNNGINEHCDILFSSTGNYQLIVKAMNVCSDPNYGPNYVRGIYVYTSYYMVVSPNPATTEATISIEAGSPEETTLKSASTATAFDENTEWEYEVYSTMQNLKAKKTKIRGKSTTINTQGWKEGVYTVRAKYKGEVLTGKLVVKK